MKGEYSIMLIYKCEQCGARELTTKVFESPKILLSTLDPCDIEIRHEEDKVTTRPREFLHQCKTTAKDEEVFGLCKFIGYCKKEW